MTYTLIQRQWSQAVPLHRLGTCQHVAVRVQHFDVDLTEVSLGIQTEMGAAQLQRFGHDFAAIEGGCESTNRSRRTVANPMPLCSGPLSRPEYGP